MAKIHPLSIVEEGARLADDVEVGPFCIVGPEVTLGAGCVLQSHVTIRGLTEIGARDNIYLTQLPATDGFVQTMQALLDVQA
jgi:UDP-N-acetylglucosamine acyltransferase